MRAGDLVLFRINGDSELKSGTLRQGLFGSLYVFGKDDYVYGFSSLEMIQVYHGGQGARLGSYSNWDGTCQLVHSRVCSIS